MLNHYVVVYKDKAGEWRWRLKARNGKIVADSGEGYASKRNARRAFAAVYTGIGKSWHLDQRIRLVMREAK